MTVPVTVCTPSIPDRASILTEAIASVQAQTVKPQAHLIRIEQRPDGMPETNHTARQRNRLMQAVDTPWLMTLDDDDVLLPHHFETIQAALETDADIVYTFTDHPWFPREDITGWTQAQIIERLTKSHTIVNGTAAIRMTALEAVGGWDEITYQFDPARAERRNPGWYANGTNSEDWDLRLRLAQHGCRFVCIPVDTWEYRRDHRIAAGTR